MLFSLLALAGLALANPTPPSYNDQTSQVTFTNTHRLLFDTDGNQIDAYGSKVDFFNGSYYLYGNSFSTKGTPFGIKSYSSNNLKDWTYNGFLFDPNSSNSPCAASGGCGRPHIVYNQKDRRYILWANAGSPGYAVATSQSPSGPFTFLTQRASIDPQFNSLQPADFTVESYGNKAYLVFSALNFADPRAGSIWPAIFQTMHVSELTDDFLNTTGKSNPIRSPGFDLIDQEVESPDLFYRKESSMWYVSASNACAYCNGSIGLLYRSKNIQGPWQRQIISGYSCNGQVEGVLPLEDGQGGTEYVWHSTSVPGGPNVGWGGHIFQPLQFNGDGSVKDLNCASEAIFTVPFKKGTAAGSTAQATSYGSPADAAYTPVCDSSQFDLYQTFPAPKPGTLKYFSANIAAPIKSTTPITLTAFKFSSYADLISPSYKFTTLGTASYNASQLSYVFNSTAVPITSNATVKAGELLGLAITGLNFGAMSTGAGFGDYCHLEVDVGRSEGGMVLFQRGAGQTSWRGLKGNTSPVYRREGKGVKFAVEYD